MDLLVRGGTVVTASGSRRADVAVEHGRIAAIEPDLGRLARVGARGRRCHRAADPAGRRRRTHPHARGDRRRARSLLPGFGGGRVRRDDHLPVVQQPRAPGSSAAAERSLLTGLREWRASTDADSAIDYGLSLVVSGRMDDPLAELPADDRRRRADLARRSWSSTSGSTIDALFEAMRVMGSRGGMLQVHCEDPVLLEAAVSDALWRGDVLPRYHATTRPSYVEAVATARASAFARMAERPVHVVHLSSAAALRRGSRRARGGRSPGHGRDLPALPRPDRRVLRRPRSGLVRAVRHLATAPVARRSRRPVGRPGRRLARPGRHGPRPRPPRDREGRGRPGRPVQPDQQRRARHRDAPDDPLLARASRAAGLTLERMVDLLVDDAGAPVRARVARAPSRSVATATSSSSTRPRAGRSAPRTCTTRATTPRTRASRSRGAVRDVFVRGRGRHPGRGVRRDARRRPVRRARPDSAADAFRVSGSRAATPY